MKLSGLALFVLSVVVLAYSSFPVKAVKQCDVCIPSLQVCSDERCSKACYAYLGKGTCIDKYQCQCHVESDDICSMEHLKPCDKGDHI